MAIEPLGRQETFENALRAIRPGGTLSSLGVYSRKLVDDIEEALDLFSHRRVRELQELAHDGTEWNARPKARR